MLWITRFLSTFASTYARKLSLQTQSQRFIYVVNGRTFEKRVLLRWRLFWSGLISVTADSWNTIRLHRDFEKYFVGPAFWKGCIYSVNCDWTENSEILCLPCFSNGIAFWKLVLSWICSSVVILCWFSVTRKIVLKGARNSCKRHQTGTLKLSKRNFICPS